MKVEIPIGKYSDGIDYAINLFDTHLFVSYSEQYQLNDFIKRLMHVISAKEFQKNIYIAIPKRRVEEIAESMEGALCFFRDDPEGGNVHSRGDLIKKVLAEMVKRQKVLKEKKIQSFSRYQ